MMKFLTKWFGNKAKPPADAVEEKIHDEEARYAVDALHTLTALMQKLHNMGDPDQIAMMALQTGCEFYQAEWCGILDCDTSVEVFTPYWWYTPVQDDLTSVLFQEFEYFEGFTRWVMALHNYTPIVVPDVEAICKRYPEEYSNYKRLECEAVMGTPYTGHALGFVALKNAKRYADRPELLQMISMLVAQQVHEKKLVEAAKVIVPPEKLENDNDVLIKLFGGLEIYTVNSRIKEADLKSPMGASLFVYLVLNRHKSVPGRVLAEAMYPNDDTDNAAKNVRALLYRLRQNLKGPFGQDIVVTTQNGYALDDNLNIMTDCDQFDEFCSAAEKVSGITSKIDLLKQAAMIYKGSIFPTASTEQWLLAEEARYHIKYVALMNELLELLNKVENYQELYQFSTTAISIEPTNLNFWHWNIHALQENGSSGMAKREWEAAKVVLSQEDYEELEHRLQAK